MNNEAFLQSSTVYINDQFVPFKKATLSIASSPVQYGLAVYTACNVIVTAKHITGFRMLDHYKRLCRSAAILGMDDFSTHVSYEKFIKIIQELIQKNSITTSVIVRVTYYINSIMAGTKIHDQPTGLAVFILPFGDYFSKPTLSVCVSSWRRIADDALPARAKVTGSYVNSSLMKSEALQNGYDDCIALDSHGHVAEGAVANVFMVKDGTLITPSTATDLLEGITRDTVKHIAAHLNIPYVERSVDRSELYTADELFFSGSSARIWPIASVDKRPIGGSGIGSITQQVAAAYKLVQHKKLALDVRWYTDLSSKIKT